MKDDVISRLMPDLSPPQPGPKWLSMSPRQRRKWTDKQWTDPDPDYDGPPLLHAPRPKSCTWVLLMIPILIGITAATLQLAENELLLGIPCLLVGLGLGAISGERSVTRANEKDLVRTVCRAVELMDENGDWVFTRHEELAVEKLQRILKSFREKVPR